MNPRTFTIYEDVSVASTSRDLILVVRICLSTHTGTYCTTSYLRDTITFVYSEYGYESITELTEGPGTGMNAVQNLLLQKFRVRL